ncbi:hypothetical protein [Phyllobacterium sp. UNC302MFCol5.2]|uniref:hypothetical protein n=1 Tax=Phyllobacterium sp. UNC302MFCol5.2 TaxID=1449065 RepID=UPI000489E623|nr:hypothetical protein [Phyllobacterium sp. UNC302MFCol5.2]
METVKSASENSAEAPGDISSEDKDRYIEIWKKAVETQMHFNEMSGKSRQLGLTFVAAALGVAVVMVARGDDFALSFFNWKIHVGVLLILAATAAIFGVRVLDLNVYHRMLRGAVTFGEDFEKNYMSKIFNLNKGMTQAISHFSRFDDASVNKDGPKYVYCGSSSLTAEKKIIWFYNVTTLFLVIAALGLFLINNFAQPSSKVSARVILDQSTNEKPTDGDIVLPTGPSQAK